MDISLGHIIFILFFHWVFDFVFQAESWAVNKSKSRIALLKHVSLYSLLWIPVALLILEFPVALALFFAGVTFILHYLTDFITSLIVADKFKKGNTGSNIPNFGAFSLIGFDQFLHYVGLFLVYSLCFNLL